MTDAEGMAMLTGAFVFLIIMFLLIAWCFRVIKKANNPNLNRALQRRVGGVYRSYGNDAKAWWDQ